MRTINSEAYAAVNQLSTLQYAAAESFGRLD